MREGAEGPAAAGTMRNAQATAPFGLVTYPAFPAFTLPDLLRMKREAVVHDFAGERPLHVSVVIPTRMESDRIELRERIIRNMFRALDPAVTAGLVNEILVIDGSKDASGEPVLDWLDRIAGIAVDEIALLHREVDVLREFPGAADKARAGYADLSVKFLHQWDPWVNRTLERMGTTPLQHRGRERAPRGPQGDRIVPSGKGAALWVAAAATKGDIVAFVDSDVRNFSTHFVEGLVGPLIASWARAGSADAVSYVKAYYKRLGVIDVDGEPHAQLGGRVTRLLAKPAFRAFADFGLFNGLEDLEYPLSGEYAATREVIESIDFATGYGVEVSTLCQVMQGWGPHAMAQVNLELFQHLSQKESSTDAMAADIAATLIHFARKYYGRGRVDREDFVDVFRDRARDLVDEYQRIVDREAALGARVVFDRGKELARIDTYATCLRKAGHEIGLLPNWRSLEEMGKIRRELRKRAGAATSEVLERIGAIPDRAAPASPQILSAGGI